MDLPCTVESFKTYDDSALVKTADIGQQQNLASIDRVEGQSTLQEDQGKKKQQERQPVLRTGTLRENFKPLRRPIPAAFSPDSIAIFPDSPGNHTD
ncbi:hypothetical protein Ddye_021014 [Dipteronia dyeriana]|uniref:TAFII55 protein conserved region domain-containing protein n=1 Tax=Dipteronia dyeriana TaxID=168575 RepID=A0AAD9U0U3_9ROSI|nr:hypothetical protein Ddye_021014 [Dipteronia dyeriana]